MQLNQYDMLACLTSWGGHPDLMGALACLSGGVNLTFWGLSNIWRTTHYYPFFARGAVGLDCRSHKSLQFFALLMFSLAPGFVYLSTVLFRAMAS